jgi:hypothetical protein
MPGDKDISRFFDEPGALPSEPGRNEKNAPATVSKPRRNKQPTGLRIDADLYDELRILKWKMLLPSMTATLDRALSEFRDSHKTELDEAKAQLGENGIRELLSRKD